MSDVKLRQESIAQVYIAWKSLYNELSRNLFMFYDADITSTYFTAIHGRNPWADPLYSWRYANVTNPMSDVDPAWVLTIYRRASCLEAVNTSPDRYVKGPSIRADEGGKWCQDNGYAAMALNVLIQSTMGASKSIVYYSSHSLR